VLDGSLGTYSDRVLSSDELLRLNLVRLRDRHNLTQEQAASLVGVGYKYYQAVEAGRRSQIRLVTLDKLARAFGLPGAALLLESLPESQIQPAAGPIGRRRAKPQNKQHRPRRSQNSSHSEPGAHEGDLPTT
jgi:transcriptional regulator with XRE-family HTH domain